jgi:hypothetical protein
VNLRSEIVEDSYAVTASQQFFADVGADKTSATCNQDMLSSHRVQKKQSQGRPTNISFSDF